ncbi:group III truncated hemoglobin [Roseisolibacter sp. H3M3-2]|uniref:group III truncated hemoglobin n=1 Tax=Roseisolibacter sp. H3M3-2 TaxID=3031323 RepID=UPI0023DB0BB7|nr:group III truncated hemoglobin [Roseisolibacter sp. H3M3-2]MDF1501373.1 group III truncated hemoglobin [Roseisolibacter sp. H3M3-2]
MHAEESEAVRPDVDEDALEPLLTAFYDAMGADAMLAPYFAPLDMAAHIPRIADFWSTLLFQSGRYQGNAFRPHATMPGLTAAHFTRWLRTLDAVVDGGWAGPVAERMKALGHRVAYSMQLRLHLTPEAAYPAEPDVAPIRVLAGAAPGANGRPA